MAGLMCATAFMSMWINNSAATSIMIPAAIAIVDELENYEKRIFSNHSEGTPEIIPNDTESKSRTSRIDFSRRIEQGDFV